MEAFYPPDALELSDRYQALMEIQRQTKMAKCKIRDVKLTMATKNDAMFNGRWVLSPLSAPNKKSRSEHNQDNKSSKTKLKKG